MLLERRHLLGLETLPVSEIRALLEASRTHASFLEGDAVKGDSLWGTDTGPDGQSDLIVGHIQGDRVSFKTGNGCTERVLQRCTVLVSGTYHGDGWKADVNDTDNQRHHVFTVTRVTGKP